MRKILALAFVGIWSFQVFAAHKDYFVAVLNSDAFAKAIESYKEGASVESIRRAQTYRCPGCFLFEVQLERGASSKEEKLYFKTRAEVTTTTDANGVQHTVWNFDNVHVEEDQR